MRIRPPELETSICDVKYHVSLTLVYESIPTLGVRRSLNLYPRLFRWGKSKIPLKSDEIDTLLNRVDITQVLPIRPFNEEENLVSEDGMPEVRRLEKIVIRQSEKIKLLEKRCAELEDQNLRHELNVAEAVVEKGEKSGEGAELDEASKDGNEANKDVEGSELSLSKLNEITVFQSSIVDNVRTRADRVKKRKGSMFVTPPSSTPRQKKRVKKQVLPIQPFNEEENLVDLKRVESSEDGISEDQNIRHELNVAEAVVEKGEKSGEGAELDEASKDGNEANKDVEGSKFSLSKLDEITVFQSSIVDNVRTRVDHVKKRKWSMFVTPPSSTPKRKTRVKKQAFVDVAEAINSLGEREMDEFRGRADFIGHEKSSDEDRKFVMEFLGKVNWSNVIVWEDEHMSLSGHALCTLLFHEPVESEIINVYMRIMRQQSLLNGSEIFCMDTNVQREILEHLEKFGKRRKIQNTDYEAFASRLSSFTRSKLMELNEEIFRRCRYVIFPLNHRWHWYLLVFNKEEGIFKLWNSKHDAFVVGTAKVYIRFLAGFLRHLSRFEIASQDLVRERCRQQGPTLNCGVYSCMWLHCLAYDTPEIWKCQQKVDVNAYRVRIAGTILGSITNVF
ncbi:hypothetical protein F511_04539 [Dorcoceras hygrometricum]|uniref:Ubiquitin-like protease family profile domain-containing protein n=1 Tax=Dorcoceras hygrometricum TaxID=472368 RepID=A0A2Z7BZI4_9LAMI|nr:hypothetical protein F511_04539 [Dorcoceras hygrometricum]